MEVARRLVADADADHGHLLAHARSPSSVNAMDICGHGKVPIDAADPFAAGSYVSMLTNDARGRWLSALQDSDDVRARAVGLLLESKFTDGNQGESIAEPSRDALVQLAVGAGDPAIYAMAVSACDTYTNRAASEACQQITLKNWASLDGDNAVPWLLLAAQAHTQNDFAAENTAFAKAAKAHKVDPYNYSLYAYAEPEMPANATALERWSLAIELVGIENATATSQYPSASKHCSGDALLDKDVRQQCSAVAELLLDKGTTLLDIRLGTAIGTRVGWENTRVARLTEEADALTQSITEAAPSDNESFWTCDGARRGIAYMGQRSRLGEVGAARNFLERSDETVAELAKRQRARIRDAIDKYQRDALERPDEFQERPESSASEANR